MPGENDRPDPGDANLREPERWRQWESFAREKEERHQDETSATHDIALTAFSRRSAWEIEAAPSLNEEERSLINHQPGRSEHRPTTRLANLDKMRYTDQFADMLGLTDDQKEEARRLMVVMNLDRFGNQKAIEKVALVVIRYVAERYRSSMGHPYRITSEERYLELIDQYGMDVGDVMRLSGKVKEEIKRLRAGSSE